MVAQFDRNGNKLISIDEFVSFFTSRVDKVLEEKRKQQGQKVAKRFREVMQAAQKKGVSAKDIFNHFDSV